MNASFSSLRALLTFSIFSIGLPCIAQVAEKSSNAQAAVPTVTYRSVFRETSLGIEQDKTDWRKANDDVGKFTRGHIDILKQEEMDKKNMNEKKSMDSKPLPTSAAPKAAPAPHKH